MDNPKEERFTCTGIDCTCKNPQPLSEFHKASYNDLGHAKLCKTCKKRRAAEQYVKHGAKIRAYGRKWGIEHRETRDARYHKWVEQNPDRSREIRREWARRNKKQCGKSAKKWAATPEGKQRLTASGHNRRVNIRGGGKFTAEDWNFLLTVCGRVCLRCGIPEADAICKYGKAGCKPWTGSLTVDHIVPIIKGGSNTISNLQPLCLPCQNIKGIKATDYRPSKVKKLFRKETT